MISLEAYSELLEVLYSAPLDQEQWQRFLTLICQHTQSRNSVLFCANSRAGITIRAFGGEGLPSQVAIEYNERYGKSDPFRGALIKNARIGVFEDNDLMPNDGLLQTDLYRNYVIHLGLRYATVVPLSLSIRRFEAISIWRTPQQGRMEKDCGRLIELLVPHVQKALQIHHVLDITQQRLVGVEAVANASPTAAFLLTSQGRMVYANAAAEKLLRNCSPLVLHNECLKTSSSRLQSDFNGLLQKTAMRSFAAAEFSATMAISLPWNNRRQPLQLLAAPLAPEVRCRTGADLLLLTADPDYTAVFPDDVLRALYNLTSSETEIANGLLMGYSLNEIASLRHVSVGTTRIQLKSILGKTATKRQSDLVRLLMALPHPNPDVN